MQRGIQVESRPVYALAFKVISEQRGRSSQSAWAEVGKLSVDKIAKELGADMAVEETVLDLVLEAAQAAVARRLAAFFAIREKVECCLE